VSVRAHVSSAKRGRVTFPAQLKQMLSLQKIPLSPLYINFPSAFFFSLLFSFFFFPPTGRNEQRVAIGPLDHVGIVSIHARFTYTGTVKRATKTDVESRSGGNVSLERGKLTCNYFLVSAEKIRLIWKFRD